MAIDIGSTSTKVAIATEQPKNVAIYDRWPLAEGKAQAPTAVLYKPLSEKEWRCVAFGQKAADEEEGLLFMNFWAHLCEQVSQLTVK